MPYLYISEEDRERLDAASKLRWFNESDYRLLDRVLDAEATELVPIVESLRPASTQEMNDG